MPVAPTRFLTDDRHTAVDGQENGRVPVEHFSVRLRIEAGQIRVRALTDSEIVEAEVADRVEAEVADRFTCLQRRPWALYGVLAEPDRQALVDKIAHGRAPRRDRRCEAVRP